MGEQVGRGESGKLSETLLGIRFSLSGPLLPQKAYCSSGPWFEPAALECSTVQLFPAKVMKHRFRLSGLAQRSPFQ